MAIEHSRFNPKSLLAKVGESRNLLMRSFNRSSTFVEIRIELRQETPKKSGIPGGDVEHADDEEYNVAIHLRKSFLFCS